MPFGVVLQFLQAALSGMLLLQQIPQPLPELTSFVEQVRKHLRSDRLLQSQYTYAQTETERQLNKDGSVKKTEVTAAEIYPSIEEGLTYRRVISKDGKPLPPSEIEKHDRDHDRKVAEYTRRLQQGGQDEKLALHARESAEKQKEDAIIREAFLMYRIEMTGREKLGGHDTIVLTFRARPEYRPESREAKFLSKVAGKAWIDEDTYQLARLEAELMDNFSLGFGILARFNSGAKAVFERRLVNNEVWLPAYASFSGTGRLMLFKALRLEVVNEFSDYRKYSVEAIPGESR